MTRRVRGMLFLDYVRMLRNHGGRPLTAHLQPEDLQYLETRIEPDEWYPMTTFERFGLAILKVIAEGDLSHVRRWGYMSAARVGRTVEGLVVPGDPRETLMRLQVFRRSFFFDFDALSFLSISDHAADVRIDYGMTPPAEEAASHQTVGFCEGLIDMAGGTATAASFTRSRWQGDPETLAALTWRVGKDPSGPSPSGTPSGARSALSADHVKG